eukprot:2172499-Amphidinium_carterae.1
MPQFANSSPRAFRPVDSPKHGNRIKKLNLLPMGFAAYGGLFGDSCNHFAMKACSGVQRRSLVVDAAVSKSGSLQASHPSRQDDI